MSLIYSIFMDIIMFYLKYYVDLGGCVRLVNTYIVDVSFRSTLSCILSTEKLWEIINCKNLIERVFSGCMFSWQCIVDVFF